jgi:hypothetical protein
VIGVIYRSLWKARLKSFWLIVDKPMQRIISRYEYNDGRLSENNYAVKQMRALVTRDSDDSYSIALDCESQTYGRYPLVLDVWHTRAERDAVLAQLQAALDLPIKAQDEAKNQGDDAAY